MAIKETVQKAKANYRKKLEYVQIELYPTDEDIKRRIAERIEAGERKASYIKRLIREDIAKTEEHSMNFIPPFGYKVKDGKPAINEEEKEIVNRAMTEMAHAGKISHETEKNLREAWYKHYGQELECTSEELKADLKGLATERQERLRTMKHMMNCSEKWKASHPRPRKDNENI